MQKNDYQIEKLVLRKAAAEDIPLILTFINELAVYEKLIDQVKTTEQDLHNNLFGNEKFAEVIIAEFEGKPAGQALFFYNFSTFLGRPGIYLEDLYVRPAFRGKGIGKALLAEIIEIAKKKKCGRVEWAVLNWNESAINFYKSLGAAAMEDWTIFRLTENKF
jgi:GNAT superfamily N-acetyltransferase